MWGNNITHYKTRPAQWEVMMSVLFWNCVQIAKQNGAHSFQQTIVKKIKMIYTRKYRFKKRLM